MQVLALLKGYKTYIIGFIGIAYGLAGYFLGFMDIVTASEVLGAALGFMGLRSGINTAMIQVLLANGVPLPPNPSAAKVRQVVAEAGAVARRAAPMMIYGMLFAIVLGATSACTTTGTGGLFDNPENDLSIAETAFSTAQVLYNTVCAVNTESPFCTAANMQTANDLANAVRNAIAKARVVLANSGSSSAQIAAAISGAQDAIRDFTKVVNDLQAAKAKAMVAKAMRVSMLQGAEMWAAVHLLGRT